jgi:hypothetical protein
MINSTDNQCLDFSKTLKLMAMGAGGGATARAALQQRLYPFRAFPRPTCAPIKPEYVRVPPKRMPCRRDENTTRDGKKSSASPNDKKPLAPKKRVKR